MNSTSLGTKLSGFIGDDPVVAAALAAALIALATTPLAFAVLGRTAWFKARRGRTLQRPSFSAVVCGMMLVMGIPAIFAGLAIKSRTFDKNRYEFDPNKTWSVLEQGRGLRDLKEADEAVKREMARLAEERKNLVENVKKLDEAMLALRAVAATSPAVAQTIPGVLQRLAGVRKSVGVDGPQQLMDFTAPPAKVAAAAPVAAPAVASATAPAPPAVTPSPAAGALGKGEVDAELAAVPEPQKTIAAMLPLTDLPPGWTVGKSGSRHIETFNADNLFEKIDGRAESFLQYGVKGMAYTYYHPAGDESNELQLYIFEMASPLKALGKYGSEKPDEAKLIAVGTEGYTSAGSLLFHAGPYYTQIVSTQDDPKFAAFALELARRIAPKQKPEAAPAGAGPTVAKGTPEAIFALLPAGPGRETPKYVAQDVFGYSFLSDVFMADYKEGDVAWQGFLRPYPDANAAKAILDQYVESVRKDGAEVKTLEAAGADRLIVSSNIGLVDVLFQKGNTIGGVNGATDAKRAEAFAREFVQKLPAAVLVIDVEK